MTKHQDLQKILKLWEAKCPNSLNIVTTSKQSSLNLCSSLIAELIFTNYERCLQLWLFLTRLLYVPKTVITAR